MFVPGSIFRFVLRGRFGDIPMSNTYMFYMTQQDAPMSFAECVTSLGEVAQEIAETYAPGQWDGWTWTDYWVATLDLGQVSGFVGLTTPVPGQIEDDPLPAQTTLQLSYTTGFSRVILRKAMMALTEGQTTAVGNYTTAAQGVWLSRGATLLSPIETDAAEWIMAHRSQSLAAPNTNVFPIAVRVSNIPQVQRRRRTA